MPSEKNYYISWEQFYRDTKVLTEALQPKGPWSKIVAITRGGLIPTAIIAKELRIRLIDTVCITSYEGKEQKPLTILKKIDIAQDEQVLFIDDLVDTGETAKAVKQMYPHAHYAVVYAKPPGKPFIDSFVSEVKQNTWIVFPWDE